MDKIDFATFQKIDMRAGTIERAEVFAEARKPAFKLWVDFGAGLGMKKTSAQITDHYQPEDLIGRQVIAVINFPPRQIGPFMSEVLVLGLDDGAEKIVLLGSDQMVPNGTRVQ